MKIPVNAETAKMISRTFEVEFPADCGPMWMNKDNLMICLTETCPNTSFIVTDVTPPEDEVPV